MNQRALISQPSDPLEGHASGARLTAARAVMVALEEVVVTGRHRRHSAEL